MNDTQSPRHAARPQRLTLVVESDPGSEDCPYKRLGLLTWLLRHYGMSIVDIQGGVDRE